MKHIIRTFMLTALLLISGLSLAAQLGKDYKLLPQAQPTSGKKVEVLEFFSYHCSHCFDLHPKLATWEKTMPKDVELTYVPTVFSDSAEPLARTFYTLEGLGLLKQLHDKVYHGYHVQKERLFDQKSIGAFLAKNGVDQAKFDAAYNSFAVQSKVTRAKQMIRSYQIEGTPTMIVNGKYVITGLRPDEAVKALNEVIEMARKEIKK